MAKKEKISRSLIDKSGDFVVITSLRVMRFFRDGMFMSSEGSKEEDSHHFVGKWRDGKIYSDYFGDVSEELGPIPNNTMRTSEFRAWQERFPATQECPADDW